MKKFARLLFVFALLLAPAAYAQNISPGIGSSTGGTQIRPGFGPSSSCSEATTFLARTSGLNVAHQSAYTNFICGLVTDAVWPQIDALYVFATSTTPTAVLNLKSTNFTILIGGNPGFVADAGFTGVLGSSTVYLDTQYNTSTAGLTFAQNAAHISLYCNTNSAGNGGIEMGLRLASSTISQITCRPVSNLAQYNINDNVVNALGITVSASNGFYLANRTGASAQDGYLNGVAQGVVPVASSALVNGTISILARATAVPTHESGANRQISFASIGGALTQGQISAFYNRILAYRTALSVP